MSDEIAFFVSVVSLCIAIAVAVYTEWYWRQPGRKGYWTERDVRRDERRALREARRNSKRYS